MFDYTLLSYLPEAYLVLDGDHTVLATSEKYYEVTGRRRDDMIGRSIYAMPTASEYARRSRNEWLRSTLNEATSARLVKSLEFHQESGFDENGFAVVKVWQLEVQRIFANESDNDVLLLRLLDKTEAVSTRERDQRARAELRSTAQLRAILVEEAREEIQSERAQLEEALVFANIGAWRLDEETGVITCTEQCRKNLGVGDFGSLTKFDMFYTLVDPRDRASVQRSMNEALENHTFFETEYRTLRNDDSVRWIMLRGKGRYDEHGVLTTLHGFTLDITARKETELRQASEVVVEKEARIESENRVSAINSFLSAVSHEIRSPLNAILSWSQVMHRSNSPQAITRACETIERNARQLALMVDDLLDAGALENGALSVRQDPVDLGAIVTAAVEDFRVEFENKGLGVRDEAIVSCTVAGDETRLRQIVYNLLSNALKYTSHGTVSVALTQADDAVTLRVSDTGRGISRELLPKIFDKFEQATREGSGRIGGLGLGLWLVKSLTELHGGTVRVRSEGVDRGAAFEVSFPGMGAHPVGASLTN